MPGGAMGVALKSKAPWIWAYADNFGLMRDPRSKFITMSACGSLIPTNEREIFVKAAETGD
jgi:hypothetical protein